ncbi:gliding motility lipoprotein GldD [Robiginitalea sediminis]|uniref:gliding motility lipoprotein GldD n=1 Tax=Robiginitalea sediminis TaxID=1982593 RepID=UPI000B4B80DE|nr:gliding motility lipoprotein GldD [Robiginitalea sediminis]
MSIRTTLTALVAAILLGSCGEDPVPKPKAMLRLDYPVHAYKVLDADCPYTFEFNRLAAQSEESGCNLVLDYKPMKGSIYITYKPVEGNLKELLSDAQKLSYEHVVKADNILEQPYVDPDNGVYGMFYEVKGDAASQSQFYVTDSTRHFVTGSLYFYAKPNYDSILPAAVYLQNDIRRLMESLRWK